MHSAHVKGLRAATGLGNRRPGHPRFAEQRVFLAAEQLDFARRIAVLRLKLMASVTHHGSHELHKLLDFLASKRTGWVAAVAKDVQDLDTYWGSDSCGAEPDALPRWVSRLRDAGDWWKSGLKRATQRMLACFMDRCRYHLWRAEFDPLVRGIAAVDVDKLPPLERAGQQKVQQYVCYDCGATAASEAAWRRHRWLQHGERHVATRYAVGGSLPGVWYAVPCEGPAPDAPAAFQASVPAQLCRLRDPAHS